MAVESNEWGVAIISPVFLYKAHLFNYFMNRKIYIVGIVWI